MDTVLQPIVHLGRFFFFHANHVAEKYRALLAPGLPLPISQCNRAHNLGLNLLWKRKGVRMERKGPGRKYLQDVSDKRLIIKLT